MADGTRRPNVVFITTDQQRYDTLGCTGNAWVRTPNLDRLAAEGVLFDRAYIQGSACMPSRASFHTGRYARTAGCPANGHTINRNEITLAKYLKDAGYVCGLSGKMHVCAHGHRYPEPRLPDDGYEEFHWSPNPHPFWPTDEYHHYLAGLGLEFRRERLEGADHVWVTEPAGHSHTAWCMHCATGFIRRQVRYDADQPWMFNANIFDPHDPWDPPRKYLERYLSRVDEIPLPRFREGELDDKPEFLRDKHEKAGSADYELVHPSRMDDRQKRLIVAAYWAMIDLIDEQIGKLLAVLEETGQADNTLVIFTSDHGEMLGDHGQYFKGSQFYEETVHVPLIFWMPGRIAGGRRSRALVELLDILPTVLEFAGLDVPSRVQGRSLAPILAGDAPLDVHKDSVFCEALQGGLDRATGMPQRNWQTMLRTDRYKIVQHHGHPLGQLYDLQTDPEEFINRWDDPDSRDAKIEMLRRLSDRQAFCWDWHHPKQPGRADNTSHA